MMSDASVEFLPEAEQDVEEAFWWYERQRAGLGLEFLLALDAAVSGVLRLPDGHALVARRTRKMLLRRFPFLLLYVLEERRILVTAVFHGRRNPRSWSDRVREYGGVGTKARSATRRCRMRWSTTVCI